MSPAWLALRKDWPWYTVSDLQDKGVLLVEDGNHGEYRPRPNEFAADGTAFIRAADLSDGRIRFSSAGHINDTALRRIRKGIGRPGDVLFSHKGTVGKLAIAPGNAPPFVCSPQTTFWRVLDGDRLDRDFLFTYMRAPEFERQWTVRKGDTDMADYVSLTAQRTLLIPTPPLHTQYKIAAVISAYDDLIENNSRRIRLLEEMAQRIYREWFVEFRYPGHEHVPLVGSALGPIPDGWEVIAFTDLADIRSGGTPRTTVPDYWNGSIPFFTPRDAPDTLVVTSTEKHITPAGLDRCNSVLYGPGTVFITARGTVGKVAMAGVPMAMNQSCYAVRGRQGVRQEFILFFLLNQVQYLKTNTGGATFDTIIVDTFRRMRSIAPPRELMGAFARTAEPFMRLIQILQDTVASMRRAQDLLLPRLMSGEIDVTDLDIASSETAA